MQREFVAVGTETGDDADCEIGEIRLTAERLACVHVRQVNFDERNRHRSERVAQRYTRMREAGRIDQDERGAVGARVLHALDEWAFRVGLEGSEFAAGCLRDLCQIGRASCRERV